MRAEVQLEPYPGARVVVERGDHRMAAVAPVAAVLQRDRALAIRIGQHLDLGREAPHEQALEARLLGVAELGLACAELAAAHDPDVVVGMGGGSCMDLAKAVAVLLAHGGAPSDYYGE